MWHAMRCLMMMGRAWPGWRANPPVNPFPPVQALTQAKGGAWGPESTLVQNPDPSPAAIKVLRALLVEYVTNLRGKTDKTNQAREAEMRLGQLRQKVPRAACYSHCALPRCSVALTLLSLFAGVPSPRRRRRT